MSTFNPELASKGSYPAEPKGDNAWAAFQKHNANFQWLADNLGSAAFRVAQTNQADITSGALMAVGALGWAGLIGLTNANDYNSVSNVTQVIGNTTGSNVPGNTPVLSGMSGFQAMSSADRGAQILIRSQGAPSGGNRAWIRGKQETWAGWSELIHSGNTIVDSNGFIKEA